MRRICTSWWHRGDLAWPPAPGRLGTTLEKINRTGASPWDADGLATLRLHQQAERVGRLLHRPGRLVHKNIEKKLGKSIKFELKESTPATRIPLLTSMAVDLITETMTDHPAAAGQRRLQPDFLRDRRPLHREEGKPRSKGPRISPGNGSATQQGSTNERVLQGKIPPGRIGNLPGPGRGFHGPAARESWMLTAMTAIQLWGLKYKSAHSRPVGSRGRLVSATSRTGWRCGRMTPISAPW